MSCDHELANEWARCSGKKGSYITTRLMLPIFGGLEGREMHRVNSVVETKRMSTVSWWLNAIFVLNISFQITERKKTLFTSFLFSLFCSGYLNEIIIELPFSRFANKFGNKELWWHRPIKFQQIQELNPFYCIAWCKHLSECRVLDRLLKHFGYQERIKVGRVNPSYVSR